MKETHSASDALDGECDLHRKSTKQCRFIPCLSRNTITFCRNFLKNLVTVFAFGQFQIGIVTESMCGSKISSTF